MKQHQYALQLQWTGNNGTGTKTYRSYARDYTVSTEGKPALYGSSDPMFRGDKSRYNPEELLLASAASCHMLSYLHLCADHGITVLSYEDAPTATMELKANGSGSFTQADLYPAVTIAEGDDPQQAEALHEEAHSMCFIANSVNFPIYTHASIHVAAEITQ